MEASSLVDLNRQDLCSDASNQMTSLASSGFKTEEDHLNIKIVDSPVCYNASILLLRGNMLLDTNKLRFHPIGMATLKRA